MDINRIKDAIKSGRINITEHADEELANDEISNESLYYSVLHGEIIEEYPDDLPFPSCLIFGRDQQGRPIHSVWAYASESNIAILITAYIPDANRWIDYRWRKKK